MPFILAFPAPARGEPRTNGTAPRRARIEQNSSILLKNGAGTLLAFSGTGPTPDGGSSTHTQFSSISDLGLFGGGNTGLLLEMYYCDVITVRDVQLQDNNDTCIDLVECWDSRFYNVVVGGCSGTPGSTGQPAMWIRCSAATSGSWGYSADNSNQIHLLGCRFEAFGTGALALLAGPAEQPEQHPDRSAPIAPVNGAAPTAFAPGTPLPQINGAVSDASFSTTPPNGTMAVDTAGKTRCIRVNGSWIATPLG